MDAAHETLLIRDAKQQLCERIPFGLGERRKQDLLVLPRHAADGVEDTAAFRGQRERIGASILGVRLALHQFSFLKLIDERHHSAGKHPERERDLLLTRSVRSGDDAQQSRMSRSDPERRQPLGKARRRMRANLSQEEGG